MDERSLDDRLRDLIAPLVAERDQLQAQLGDLNAEEERIRQEFKERRGDLRLDIGKIDRAIKPLTGEDKAAKNRRRTRRGRVGVSQARVEEILAVIQELVEETGSNTITIPQVAQRIGVDPNTVRRAMEGPLREREVVMKGGRAPKTGTGQPPIEYKFMGVEAHA